MKRAESYDFAARIVISLIAIGLVGGAVVWAVSPVSSMTIAMPWSASHADTVQP